MSDEYKIEFCKCNELAKKLEDSVNDNEILAKMIRDLRQENEGLRTEFRNRPSNSTETRSGTSGDENGYKKFEAVVEINHGWKKDYEELQTRYEMLSGEKRLLEDKERKLNERINELKKRNKHELEDAEEIIRMLTAELDACKALEQARRERGHYSENRYLSERGGSPRHQVQLVHPYHQVHERRQMEQHTLENCIPDSLTQGDNMSHM